MKNWIIGVLSAVGALATSLLGGWDAGVQTLVVCMDIDYLSGMCVAGLFHRSSKTKSGGLESGVGWKGLVRKGMQLAIVMVGAQLDALMGSSYVRDAVCIAFTVNEVVSILENAGLVGIPIPAVLRRALDVLAQKGEVVKGTLRQAQGTVLRQAQGIALRQAQDTGCDQGTLRQAQGTGADQVEGVGEVPRYSAAEKEEIIRNSLGKTAYDCSGCTGWLCTGDKQYSAGQLASAAYQTHDLAAGVAGSILYTSFGGKGRHVGIDMGYGYCLDMAYESTDKAMRESRDSIRLSSLHRGGTPWEISFRDCCVDYTGATNK